jgi:hypothetical protein
VVLSSGDDRVEDQIGFRTVEVRGTQILLNGKALFLRGISMHEEAPFRSGRAFSAEDASVLLGWAKELGCNFVRMAHYPYNENMIRAGGSHGHSAVGGGSRLLGHRMGESRHARGSLRNKCATWWRAITTEPR